MAEYNWHPTGYRKFFRISGHMLLSITPTAVALAACTLIACGLENAVEGWNGKPYGEESTGHTTMGLGTTGPGSMTGGTDPGETESAGTSTSGVVPVTASTSAATDGPPGTSTGPETTTTTGEPIGCGPEAECDDAKQANCWQCTRDRLVFVTSALVQGDFGTKPGLDDLCNQLAMKAGLLVEGQKRFKVWISTSGEDAIDRFYHSPGRYVLVNGEIFAQSWESLIAGEIEHPLNIDENGNEVSDVVWTDTQPDGRAIGDSPHCDDWSSKDLSVKANYGYSTEIDGEWTQAADGSSPTVCADIAALYCFEFA